MNNNEMLDVVLNGISEEDINNKEQIINMLIKSFNKAKISGSERAQHFKEMIKLIQSKESNEELSFYNVRFRTVNGFIDKVFLTEQEINKYKKHSNKDINDTIIELLTISLVKYFKNVSQINISFNAEEFYNKYIKQQPPMNELLFKLVDDMCIFGERTIICQ